MIYKNSNEFLIRKRSTQITDQEKKNDFSLILNDNYQKKSSNSKKKVIFDTF